MKLQYSITGVGDGINYGVYSTPYNEVPMQNPNNKLISTHKTLKEAMSAIRKYENDDKEDKMVKDQD